MRGVRLAALLAVLVSPAAVAQQADVLAEVRVHGNHTTPDAEVMRLAGLTLGQALLPSDIESARRRLDDSGRFDEVEVRKRYRSLSESGEVALIVIVREHPVPDDVLVGTPAVLRPVRRLMASGMFLPILGFADGYGFTYGARVTFADTLGRGGRVSIPLTWGGTKRAAVEADRPLARGPFDRLTATAAVWRRANPFFDRDEGRREVFGAASRGLGRYVRAGLEAGYARVTFGELDERLGWYGANLTFDTRQDPVFPRNAVYAEAGWSALRPATSGRANTFRADVRAYRGLVGQSVLCVRWQSFGADAALPLYERRLLGGAGNLRGYRAGSGTGDNLAAASVEVRVPLSSPMGIARAGFSVFADTGTVWDHGSRLADQSWRRGVGGGVFLLASVFQLSLDVGIRQGGGARVHFSTGLQF